MVKRINHLSWRQLVMTAAWPDGPCRVAVRSAASLLSHQSSPAESGADVLPWINRLLSAAPPALVLYDLKGQWCLDFWVQAVQKSQKPSGPALNPCNKPAWIIHVWIICRVIFNLFFFSICFQYNSSLIAILQWEKGRYRQEYYLKRKNYS